MYVLFRGEWYTVITYETIDGLTYYTLPGIGRVASDQIESLDFD